MDKTQRLSLGFAVLDSHSTFCLPLHKEKNGGNCTEVEEKGVLVRHFDARALKTGSAHHSARTPEQML